MKRFAAIAAALVVAMSAILMGSPAEAATKTSQKCVGGAFDNAVVCTSITYKDQADGSGFVFLGASSWADVGNSTKKITVSIKVCQGNGTVVWSNGVTTLNDSNSWAKSWNPANQNVGEAGYWHNHMAQYLTGDPVFDSIGGDIQVQLN